MFCHLIQSFYVWVAIAIKSLEMRYKVWSLLKKISWVVLFYERELF